MNRLWIGLICIYQRFLSPFKGYRCAHAAYFGGVSCSHAVKDIIRAEGLFAGLPSIRERFRACAMAAGKLREKRKQARKARWKDSSCGASGRWDVVLCLDVTNCSLFPESVSAACESAECLSGGAEACSCWPF